MEAFYINIGSFTYAQKASNILTKNGYNSRVGKNALRDCSYGVYTQAPSREAAMELLRINKIPLGERK